MKRTTHRRVGLGYEEEETAELAKTAKKAWLSDLGVLRGSLRLGRSAVSGRPKGLHDTQSKNVIA